MDLLEKMLDLDGDRRITAADVLAHPYLTQYSDPIDEPICSKYDASFEADELDTSAWKSKFACLYDILPKTEEVLIR